MSIVTITLNNKNFQLACSPESEEQLKSLAAEIDKRVMEMKAANPSASSELLLVMTTLAMQDHIMTLESKLGENPNDSPSQNNEEFAETLSTIASYLENLAKKIGK
jgi:cell division protein ZapA (FtsZ GTPase activity inhibitor)